MDGMESSDSTVASLLTSTLPRLAKDMANTASIYANFWPQLKIFLCFQRVDDIPPLFSIHLILTVLFRILKTVALTTISELNDSSKNFVLPGASSTWASMGHKSRETTQVFKRNHRKTASESNFQSICESLLLIKSSITYSSVKEDHVQN